MNKRFDIRIVIGVLLVLFFLLGFLRFSWAGDPKGTIKLIDHQAIDGNTVHSLYQIFRVCVDGYEYILAMKRQGGQFISQNIIQAHEIVHWGNQDNQNQVLPKRCR